MSIVVDIHKRWAEFSLDVQLAAEDEVVGLLGESGSGKSMTLRCIAGIVTPDSGKIILNGRTLFDSEKKINLTPRERGVGLMFQSYALFPNMTVTQNITSGVHDKSKRKSQAAFYVDLLRLGGLENRYPHQLSGGQQQRVALARMMAGCPEILMLDEPFSALDGQLRQAIEPEFIAALEAFHGTVLYVSHSISEVYRYSNKAAMICHGSIIESGETHELFTHPKTRTGAQLLCCKNLSEMEKIDDQTMMAMDWNIPLPVQGCRYVGIHEDDVLLSLTQDGCSFAAKIEQVQEHPRYTVMHLRLPNAQKILVAACDKALANKLIANENRAYVKLPYEKLLLLQD
ncbi:ATP-binding cassette domain-containing protein [Oscillospiraceae bacterium PP1C4]